MFSIIFKTKMKQEVVEEGFSTSFSTGFGEAFRFALEEISLKGADSLELSIIPLSFDKVNPEEVVLKRDSIVPNITMCKGKKCKIKSNCLRYLTKTSKLRKSFFIFSPLMGDGTCNQYLEKIQKKVKA